MEAKLGFFLASEINIKKKTTRQIPEVNDSHYLLRAGPAYQIKKHTAIRCTIYGLNNNHPNTMLSRLDDIQRLGFITSPNSLRVRCGTGALLPQEGIHRHAQSAVRACAPHLFSPECLSPPTPRHMQPLKRFSTLHDGQGISRPDWLTFVQRLLGANHATE